MKSIILLILFAVASCLPAQVIWSTGSPSGLVPIYMAKYEQSGEPDELPAIAFTQWGSSGIEGLNVFNPHNFTVTPVFNDAGDYTLTVSNVPKYLTGNVHAQISTPGHGSNIFATGTVTRDSNIVVNIKYPSAESTNGFDLILYILKP